MIESHAIRNRGAVVTVLLAWSVMYGGAAWAQGPRVFVAESQPAEAKDWFDSGVLARELFRQALLVAARDELNLPTRDVVLGEPRVDDQPVIGLLMHAERGYRIRLTVTMRMAPDGPEGQMRLPDIAWRPSGPADRWPLLLDAAEQASRQDMPKILRRARFQGEALALSPERAIPDDMGAKLAAIDLFSQFEAVRQAHLLAAEWGQSPATLAALIRGYANLSILTDHFWSPMSKALGARSLLYAQRWCAREPDRPEPLWHRAYAWWAVGVPRQAQLDLAAADALHDGQTLEQATDVNRPAWLDLLRLALVHDYATLLARVDAADAEAGLAGLLAVRVVEIDAGTSLTVSVTRKAQKAAPDSLWLVDVLAQVAGVALNHRVTYEGPELLASLLQRRLPPVVRSRLPQDAESYRRAPTRRDAAVALIQVTREATALALTWSDDDGGEADAAAGLERAGLSWAVLGTMIDEANVLQMARRLRFEARDLAWSHEHVEKFVASLMPAVEHHPFAAYFKSWALRLPDEQAKAAELFAAIDAPDIGLSSQWVTQRASSLNVWPSVSELALRRSWNIDATQRDLYHAMSVWRTAENRRWLLGWMRGIAPTSPATVAQMIYLAEKEEDVAEVDARLEQWMRDYRDHPGVLRAIVGALKDRERLDEAIPLLEHYIDIAPASWPIDYLAWIYQQRDDDAKWLETKKRRFEFASHGLDHAQAANDIANRLMYRGRFDEALPWAEQAAQSGAGWAMTTLAACYEGLGRLPEAEHMIRRVAHRYEASQLNWYLWCRRTGYGDVVAAADFAAEQLAAVRSGEPAFSLDDWTRISVRVHDDDLNAVAAAAEAAYTQPDQISWGLMAATVCDQVGDIERRDALMRRLLADCEQKKWDGCLELFKAVTSAWAGDTTSLPAEKLDELVNNSGSSMDNWARLMLAEVLWRLDRRDESRALLARELKLTSISWTGYHWAWKLAEWMELDPRQVRGWPDVAPRALDPARVPMPAQTAPSAPPAP